MAALPSLSRRSFIAASAVALLNGCAHIPAGDRLMRGKSMFAFSDWKGPTLSVHTYVPIGAGANTPILFVMHGVRRNASEYRDNWIGVAERKGVIIVSPEFDAGRFPGNRGYATGGMMVGASDGSTPSEAAERFAPAQVSAFDAIEPIFDAVRAKTGSRISNYTLFGHSAGGQFAHRFMLLANAPRAAHIISANSGWYTFANETIAFPYGLGEVPGAKDILKRALARRMTILLGTGDIDTADSNLRNTPAAVEQGPHRLARGQSFFADASQSAAALGVPFAWAIKYAPGVGHDNGALAAIAYDIAFPAVGSR